MKHLHPTSLHFQTRVVRKCRIVRCKSLLETGSRRIPSAEHEQNIAIISSKQFENHT